jgi:hypothetical protein
MIWKIDPFLLVKSCEKLVVYWVGKVLPLEKQVKWLYCFAVKQHGASSTDYPCSTSHVNYCVNILHNIFGNAFCHNLTHMLHCYFTSMSAPTRSTLTNITIISCLWSSLNLQWRRISCHRIGIKSVGYLLYYSRFVMTMVENRVYGQICDDEMN